MHSEVCVAALNTTVRWCACASALGRVFKTVFLPIIIFESGFAMQKHPFFTQLGSILMFALLGTLISTLVTGMLVLHLGRLGAFTQFSLEEAMSFASLISATDPVATLSVFQALNVDHKLYAIVYGESVLNDAVAIVLYATFTRFITTVSGAVAWGDSQRFWLLDLRIVAPVCFVRG